MSNRMITTYKADALQYTNQPPREHDGLILRIVTPIPGYKVGTPELNRSMTKQGEEIADALRKVLPGGTLDALVDQLALRKQQEEFKAESNRKRREKEDADRLKALDESNEAAKIGEEYTVDLRHIKAFQEALIAKDGKLIGETADRLRFQYHWNYDQLRQCAQDANVNRWDFEDLLQLAEEVDAAS